MSIWVLLHGTPLTPAIWQATADALTDQRVVVPDCTRVPATDAQASLARQVAASLGDEVLDVVGHSFGGQVAIELALLRPAKVRTLTILCSRDTPFPAFARSADSIRNGNPPPVEASLARWFTGDEIQAEGAALREARDELMHASPPDWAEALDAIAAYDRTANASELTMPVTLIAAGGDLVSTASVMEDFAGRLPRAKFQLQRDWMHMSLFVDPRRLATILHQSRDEAMSRL